MRNLVLGLAAAMVLGMGVKVTHAADSDKKTSGVLIDNSCAEKFMSKDNPEQAAAKHPVACALKCAKGDNGSFVLIHEKKELKLDKAGQAKALAYLSKAGAKTQVTITGEVSGDEIKVDSIDATPAKD